LALSKADLVDEQAADAARADWSQRLGPDVPVLLTSSVTGIGIDELARQLMYRVPVRDPDDAESEASLTAGRRPDDDTELAEHRVYRPAAGRNYAVERVGDGSFRVSGRGVERLVARYDLDNEDALAHLERRLRGIGVVRALESAGFEPGDEVEIAGIAFELDPEPGS
jgi:GTP-binding protein